MQSLWYELFLAQTETMIFIFLSFSSFSLCFLYIILFWLKIIDLMLVGSFSKKSMRKSNEFYVSPFWDKFSVLTELKAVIIFPMHSSVSLFLMNFTVLALVEVINSAIAIIITSPSYALVKSIVSNWFYLIPYNTFSYFWGTTIFTVFFFFVICLYFSSPLTVF